mgnify:CR=1 FL=1
MNQSVVNTTFVTSFQYAATFATINTISTVHKQITASWPTITGQLTQCFLFDGLYIYEFCLKAEDILECQCKVNFTITLAWKD